MAKPRRNANVELLGVVRRRRPALLVTTALCASATIVVSLPANAQPAPNARPAGGVVVGGSAAISATGNQTTINQSSQRTAINWQTFNVGGQQSVQFNQPSSASTALNRVETPNPSQIAGKINANGQIIIENQSGVIFYKGSQVNTAGLMVTAATSSDAATRAFIGGGKLALDQAASPNAGVVNQGQITVKQAGLAALVSPQVVNSGVISARLGRVVLAGASKATLDLYGDSMLSIDVTGQVVQAPNGATALVTNSGLIVADGGSVQLTARAADGLVQTLVNAGGKLQANSVGGHLGTITLNGVGGSITVEGQLGAMGNAPGTAGGNIIVNSTANVLLADTAKLNASGKAGGGTIAIGTTLKRAKGGPTLASARTAQNVWVQSGATIAADATAAGNGGRVTLLSSNATQMDGGISAKGGPQGGNGGLVEVSSTGVLNYTGFADLRAPMGTAGTLLLDPIDIEISGSLPNSDITAGTPFGDSGKSTGLSILSAATLNAALTSGTVVVTTTARPAGLLNGSIVVDSDATVALSNNQLTLQAAAGIVINGVISGPGTLVLNANGTIPNLGTGINTPYGTKTSHIVVPDACFGLSICEGAGGAINFAATLTGSATGPVSLTGTNSIATLGAIGAPFSDVASAFALVDSTGLTVNGVSAATVSLTAPTLSIAGTVTGTTSVALTGTAGNVAETGTGVISGDGALTANSTGGSVTLASTSNAVASVAGSATNAFTLADIFGLTVNGVSAATVSLTAPALSIAGTVTGTTSVALNGTNGDIGDVAETGAGVISGDGALTANSAGGSVTLANASNAVASVTGSASGAFTLADSAPLTVNGVSAPTVSLTAPTLSIAGTVTGTTGVTLNGTAGNVAETGAGLVSVSVYGVLTANSTGGSVTLTNPSNIVASVGGSATGGFALTDAAGLTLAVTGPVTAGAGQTIALQADNLLIGAALTAPGGTVAIAPTTSALGMSLDLTGGTGTLSLSQTDLSFIRTGASGALQLGSLNGGTSLQTSSLSINTTVNIPAAVAGTLGLYASGPIGDASGGLTVGTLTGAATGPVSLTGTNGIATLGAIGSPFLDMGSAFTLLDGARLTVNGVSAATLRLTAPTLSIAGTTTGTTSVALSGTAGNVAETGAGAIAGNGALTATSTGGSVTLANPSNAVSSVAGSATDAFTLVNSAGLTVNGVDAATVSVTAPAMVIAGTVTGTTSVALSGTAGTVVETGAGVISGDGVLTATSTGQSVTLANASNAVASVAGSATDAFTLADGLGLTVNGVNAATVSLTAPTLSIAGTVAGTTSVALSGTAGNVAEAGAGVISGDGALTAISTGGSVTLAKASNAVTSVTGSATNGFTLVDSLGLTVNGVNAAAVSVTAPTLSIAGTLTGTTSVALSGTAGNVAETGAGVISGDGALTANSTGGSVTLANASNAVASVGGSATGGFTLTDGAGLALAVTAAVTAGTGQTIALQADKLSIGAALTAPGGTVAIAPTTSTLGISLDLRRGAGTLSLSQTDLSFINTGASGALHLGSLDGGTSLQTSSLSINTTINIPTAVAGTLGLYAAGPISDARGGLRVGTLTGSATGPVSLTGTNGIATLGAIGLPFSDVGSAFTLVDSAGLTVNGVTAGTVSLTAPTLSIAGTVTGTTSVALSGTAGNVAETGTGVISGDGALTANSTAGSVTLANASNAVASAGGSATGAFTLVDSTGLTVNRLSAATVSLTAPALSIAGTVTGTTSVALNGSSGNVAETGVGVISGDGALTANSTGGSVTLANGSNAVASVAGSAPNGFTLVDSAGLTVNGVSAAMVSLTASTLSIAGTVTGTTGVALSGTAGSVAEAGAGVISGDVALTATSTGGSVTLANSSNAVASVAGSATDAFTLVNSAGLTVNGVGAATVSLTAPTLSIAGMVTGTSGVALSGTAGSVAETRAGAISGDGALTANSTGGSVTLANPSNAVASVGGSATGAFTLVDSAGLMVNGMSAATVSLTAPTLSIAGTLTGTTVALAGTTGNVAEAGAGMISGDGALTANSTGGSVTLANASNAVASVGGSATGAFTLVDSTGLTVNRLSAATVSLTAPALSIAGTVTGTTSVALNGSSGNVAETGVGVISGDGALTANSTGGSVTLANASNAVASAGGSATDAFTLVDSTGLTVNRLSAATVSLTAPALSIAGTVTGTTSVALNGSSGNVAETGVGVISGDGALTANSTGGSVTLANASNALASVAGSAPNGFTLVDSAGLTVNGVSAAMVSLTASTLSIAGTVTGTTGVALSGTAGSVAETGAGVIFGGGALTANSTGGSVTLTNPSNAAASVGGSATDGFTLVDSTGPTVNGVSAATVSLTAPALSIAGTLTGTTSVVLKGTAGDVAETGAGVISGDGALTANSTDGSVTLANASNAVASVGGSAPGAFTLVDRTGLTVIGISAATVSLTAQTLSIAGTLTGTTVALTGTAGNVAEAGAGVISGDTALTANSTGGSVTLANASNAVASVGGSATGAFTLVDSAGLTVNGVGATTVSLTAPTLSIAGTLTGSTSVALTSGLGGITLGTSAAVSAPTIDLNGGGGAIMLTGNASLGSATAVVDLTTTAGGVSEAGTSTITAATLQSASGVGGTVSLTDTNAISSIGNFTVKVPASFILNDGVNLRISGLVSAATIAINDGAHTISLGNGGFVTSGVARPKGTLLPTQLPPFSSSITNGEGAYLSAGSVIQTGGSFPVCNLSCTQPSVLAITLFPTLGHGTLQFSSGGLDAPDTWLIMNIGNGQASGTIHVAALDVNYSPPPNRVDLSGTIAGFGGIAAAAAGFIEPQPNPFFRVNDCPIHSVECVLLAIEGVPTASPLNDILLGSPFNSQNPEDLVVPVVSAERYELNDILLGSPFNSQNPEDLVVPVVSEERYEMLQCNNPNAPEGCPDNARQRQ